MNAVVYLRFSPRRMKPGEEDPNEKQERLIIADCERRGVKIRATFHDSLKSGADRDRPGLQAALDALKRGEELVVYDWKRLARDVLHTLIVAEEVRSKRSRLYSVVCGYFEDDSDALRFSINAIQAVFAQQERRDMAKRTSEVMRRRQANGERMSKIPPYGKRVEGSRLVDDAHEQDVIAVIVQWWKRGDSLREIARALTGQRIENNRGTWNHLTVKAILRRAGALKNSA